MVRYIVLSRGCETLSIRLERDLGSKVLTENCFFFVLIQKEREAKCLFSLMITSIKQNLEINMPKIQVKILINLFELKLKFYFFK